MLALSVVLAAARFFGLGPQFEVALKRLVRWSAARCLGLDLRMQDVSVSLRTGEAQLRGIFASTAEGVVVRVDQCMVKVAMRSIGSDEPVVERLRIDGVTIVAPVRTALRRWQSLRRKAKASYAGADRPGRIRIRVDDFECRNCRIRLAGIPLICEKTLSLPVLTMADLCGPEETGLAPKELLRRLAAAVLEEASKVTKSAALGGAKRAVRGTILAGARLTGRLLRKAVGRRSEDTRLASSRGRPLSSAPNVAPEP